MGGLAPGRQILLSEPAGRRLWPSNTRPKTARRAFAVRACQRLRAVRGAPALQVTRLWPAVAQRHVRPTGARPKIVQHAI